jgi:hypothetical protein
MGVLMNWVEYFKKKKKDFSVGIWCSGHLVLMSFGLLLFLRLADASPLEGMMPHY